ncbi:hypothetical protein NC651_003753 [Populus alba x Populus x berolinensis]|nr:hypothetical protein NC651_003753 [Populus alba x Populus x berolinensis]
MSRDVINKVNSLKRINHFNLINLESVYEIMVVSILFGVYGKWVPKRIVVL